MFYGIDCGAGLGNALTCFIKCLCKFALALSYTWLIWLWHQILGNYKPCGCCRILCIHVWREKKPHFVLFNDSSWLSAAPCFHFPFPSFFLGVSACCLSLSSSLPYERWLFVEVSQHLMFAWHRTAMFTLLCSFFLSLCLPLSLPPSFPAPLAVQNPASFFFCLSW